MGFVLAPWIGCYLRLRSFTFSPRLGAPRPLLRRSWGTFLTSCERRFGVATVLIFLHGLVKRLSDSALPCGFSMSTIRLQTAGGRPRWKDSRWTEGDRHWKYVSRVAQGSHPGFDLLVTFPSKCNLESEYYLVNRAHDTALQRGATSDDSVDEHFPATRLWYFTVSANQARQFGTI